MKKKNTGTKPEKESRRRRERKYILSTHSVVNQQSVNWASSIVGALQQKTESLLTLVFRTGLITIQTVFLPSMSACTL